MPNLPIRRQFSGQFYVICGNPALRLLIDTAWPELLQRLANMDSDVRSVRDQVYNLERRQRRLPPGRARDRVTENLTEARERLQDLCGDRIDLRQLIDIIRSTCHMLRHEGY